MHTHIYLISFNNSVRIFSSLRESAAKFLMPSDNLSLAILSSFISQRNLASLISIFFKSDAFPEVKIKNYISMIKSKIINCLPFFTVKYSVSGSLDNSNSSSNFGLIVNKSHPANALISPNTNQLYIYL